MKLTKEEKSWVLYDVANSAFVLIIVTTVMPIFFKDIASKGVADAVSTGNWAFANSLASLLLAFMAPIMGVFADYKLFKKRFLMGFLSLGILFTLLLTAFDHCERRGLAELPYHIHICQGRFLRSQSVL
jgi:UMF1 family MFS transporter